MKKDDQVFFLQDYNWIFAKVISFGKKTALLEWTSPSTLSFQSRVLIEKIAASEELVVIVWECWKGRNGRGGYRIERVEYPTLRIPAKNIGPAHSTIGRYTEDKKPDFIV